MAEPWESDPIDKPAGDKAAPWESDPIAKPAAATSAPAPNKAPLSEAAPNLSDPDMRTAVERSYIGRIWDNFRSGFNEGAGPEPLGLSAESVKDLQKLGWWRTGDEHGLLAVTRAADEALFYRGAQILDGFMRTPNAIYRGLQAAGIEAGLPRDVVSIPDAFMGDPGAVTAHDVVPSPIGPVRYGMERAAELAGKRVDVTRLAPELEANPPPSPIQRSAVRTGISEVDSVIASPVTTDAIDNPVIDRSHTVPYMAGGSVPLEDPTVYIDKHVPKEQTAPRASDPAQTVTFDPAEPWAIHENVEQHVMELLIKGGMKDEEAYRVAHWKFAEPAEQAWYRAHDIDQVAAEKEQQTWLPKIQHEATGPSGSKPFKVTWNEKESQFEAHDAQGNLIGHLQTAAEPGEEGFAADTAVDENWRRQGVASALYEAFDRRQGGKIRPSGSTSSEAWNFWLAKYPGKVVEYVKQQAREIVGNIKSGNFEPEYAENADKTLDPVVRPMLKQAIDQGLRGEPMKIAPPAPKERPALPPAASATDVPSNLYKKPYPHSDVAGAKHESVEEAQPSPDEVARAMDIIQRAPELKPELAQAGLQAAKDLGVIGPGKPSIDNLAPKEAAAAAIPGGPKVTQEVGEQPNPWQQRFEHFVSNLKAPDEVQNLIREAAKVNGDFEPARQGEIPLSHVESIAEAAGVEPGTVDPRGLGRLLKNDAEVRTAMQLMLQVTDNLNNAARVARAEASPENLIALQEAIMRRDMAVEQVVGLRAEWGRTGKVFQEFLQNVKDQQALDEFLKGKGRTPEDLKKIADAIAGLNSPGAIARFANDMRKPTFWDKYLFYWVNALISGPITHAKYIGANAAFAAYEAGVVTPVAGALGTARRAVTGSAEGVYLGEGPARVWGLLAGTPDALRAAYRAAKENIQVPLPGEVAQNINPVINQKPNPIGGPLGAVIGIPSRGAAGIHSFFNFLGYRAEIEAQAYRQAAKEGLDGDAFWRRRGEIADNPTAAVMDKAIENGYRLTFIQELGKWGKAIERLVNYRTGGAIIPGGTQPLKLILPFMHIPANLLKRGVEMTPVAPFIDSEMRADLMGTNGAVAQDTAIARFVAGGVVSGMVANWAVNDTVTGYGPTDPNERALWLRTHEPYSVRLGNWWVSYNKFGPIGDLIGLTANLTDIGPKLAEGDYNHAAGHIVKATSRLLEDEVGMQGLVNLIDALNDPDNKGKRFGSSLIASNMPYSSALRQTASFNDPYMREAKTFVDQLRYNTPWSRQDLLPKRDWLGAPMTNPGYGTLLRSRAVNADPIDLELQRLQIKPSPPQDRIGGVKLTPQLYDEYQTTAGPLTREIVGSMVESPGWRDLPDYVRETAIRHGIEAGRKQGAAAMQMQHPQLILDGLQQQIDHITGAAHTSRPKNPPANLENELPAEPQ